MKSREAEEKIVCPNLRAKLALVPTAPGTSSISSLSLTSNHVLCNSLVLLHPPHLKYVDMLTDTQLRIRGDRIKPNLNYDQIAAKARCYTMPKEGGGQEVWWALWAAGGEIFWCGMIYEILEGGFDIALLLFFLFPFIPLQ